MRELGLMESIVAAHTTPSSCWVILHGKVYDVTSFLSSHPGGAASILGQAGKDASKVFDELHAGGTLGELPKDCYLGDLDPATLPAAGPARSPQPSPSKTTTGEANIPSLPPLSAQINLDDFEKTAHAILPEKAWAYYSSAADDLLTLHQNTSNYRRILLRPRMLRNITTTSTATTFLGRPVSLPIFTAPAALARLAHPEGEKAICRAAGRYGIIQCLSTNASMSPETVASAATGSQKLWFQLYVQTDRRKTEALLKRVRETGRYEAIVPTLDASWPGKREADERLKHAALPAGAGAAVSGQGGAGDSGEKGGLAKALFAGTAGDLVWDELAWIQEKSGGMPIILKGIQTWEDVRMAASYPSVKGVILSNHGGRALDTAPDSCLLLLELRRYCPEVFSKLEIYVDGGVRRGTDVVKALCLGARGVAIGRPVLYGLAGYGQDGVERVLQSEHRAVGNSIQS